MCGILKVVASMGTMTGLSLSMATAFHVPCPRVRQQPSLFLVPRSQECAREGALPVEWERVGELRLEDDDCKEYPKGHEKPRSKQFRKDTEAVHRAVFCGYKVTKEDYYRLRSADPDEPQHEDYSI
jgi:hypothetical protein